MYLEKESLISPSQYGFRKGRSIQSQLTACMDVWTKALSEGKCAETVYTDFAAAYDVISHPKLLYALFSLGISGPVLRWINSLVTNRSFAVKTGVSSTAPRPVTSGLLQGSSLSCTLWLCFMNSLLVELNAIPNVSVYAYADDAKIISTCPLALQTALDCLSKWVSDWQMRLSLPKCFVYQIGEGPRNDYVLCGSPLSYSSERCVRDLGVLIDPALTFRPHVTRIISKARSVIGLIFRVYRHSQPETIVRAYQTFALPHLEFAAPVFGSISAKLSDSIERVQHHFTHRLYRRFSLRQKSYPVRCRTLGLIPVSTRRRNLELAFVHSVALGLHYCPQLNLSPSRGTNSLRFPHKLVPDLHPRGARKLFIRNRLAERYNRLPGRVKRLRKAAFAGHLLSIPPSP